jgi:hypothetical protein
MHERHSRTFIHDGTKWHVWPSFVRPDEGCRGWKATDLGPPRLFFHAATGDFRVVPYPEQSWDVVTRLSEAELGAWLASGAQGVSSRP